MKKVIAMMLVVMMIAAMLGACGGQEGSAPAAAGTPAETQAAAPAETQAAAPAQTQAAAPAETQAAAPEEEDEDIVDIKLCFPTSSEPVDTQADKVEAAINAISEEQIHVHVDIDIFSMGAWDQQMSLAIAAGEQLDLMPTFFVGGTSFAVMHSSNQLMPLNDLLEEYGQDILALTKPEYLETTTFNGEILAVPQYRDIVSNLYFHMRKDVLEDLDLMEQAQAVHSVADMEALFAIVKEKTDLIPLSPAGTAGVLNFQPALLYGDFDDVVFYDQLVSNFAVTMDYDPDTVVCLYDTEEFKASAKLLEDWFNKGYIYPDAATTDLSNHDLMQSGKFFSCFSAGEAATASVSAEAYGYEVVDILVCSLPVTTGNINVLTWVIPVTCKEPEAAMKFMNLMYSNKAIVDLFNFGIEGEDYIVLEDGTFDFPEGVDNGSSKYHINTTWMFGNQYNAGVWLGFDPNVREISRQINDSAKTSPLLGFTVDTSDLTMEMPNLNNAYQEYYRQLNCGTINVDAALPEFQAKLKAGGIDDVIANVQGQLDAWKAQQ